MHGVPQRGITDKKVKEVAGELRGRGVLSMLFIDMSPGPNMGSSPKQMLNNFLLNV